MSERRRYDVIVVGARCAGSALATFLAQSVDRDRRGTDQVLSTHTIHPPGVDVLDELGVGDAIRAVTPRTGTIRLRKGGSHVDIVFPSGRDELCPRRTRLDALLQDAAAGAGAEVRDRTRATRVLFERERAVGVELQHGGRQETVLADLIVGADGRRSLVARLVGAEEYMAYDAPRAIYWAYWNVPAAWRTGYYPFDMYLAQIGLDFRSIFQTDDDQLLIATLPDASVARTWTSDPRAALLENLNRDEVIAPLVVGSAPASGARGTVKERYYFRRAVGDGWALVGDAGHHKDFIVGDGITEALSQARSLARAITEGTTTALRRWWRTRDVAAWPTYHWGRDQGEVAPPRDSTSHPSSRRRTRPAPPAVSMGLGFRTRYTQTIGSTAAGSSQRSIPPLCTAPRARWGASVSHHPTAASVLPDCAGARPIRSYGRSHRPG